MASTGDPLVLYVNGRRHQLPAGAFDPQSDLLSFLRRDLRLTGTKDGCSGQGACGACSVTVSRWDDGHGRVDHAAVNACLVRMGSLHRSAVTTVEGLGSVAGGMHPVQERIYKAHGTQCGFCTPGMVMSMSSLLRSKNGADLECGDVELAIQGNLCRCTGYRPIVEAFRSFMNEGDREEKKTSSRQQGKEVATFDPAEFGPYDGSCDPGFPSELKTGLRDGKVFVGENEAEWHMPVELAQVEKLVGECRRRGRKFRYHGGGTGGYAKKAEEAQVVIQLTHVEELRKVEFVDEGVWFGSAKTMKELRERCLEVVSARPSEQTKVFGCLAAMLKSWVNAQVRGVATIGGHLGWGHPCSDLIPIWMASGCEVEVVLEDGRRATMSVGENLALKEKTWLMTRLKVPFTKQGQECLYYRRGRRKEFDLPVANAAFFGTVGGGEVNDVKVVVGGAETVFENASLFPAANAANAMKYLEGRSHTTFSRSDLAAAVMRDVAVDERAPGRFSTYRRCLVAVFAERFLKDAAFGRRAQTTDGPIKSHCLFEKVSEGQSAADALQRPIPHNWAAEQATGEARFIGDIPAAVDEVTVVPLLSARARAKVLVDFSDAVQAEGVLGSLTADDLADNRYGEVIEDEEIIASREVAYAGQFLGALVCENPAAGRDARKRVKVSYEAIPHKLHVSEVTEDPANQVGMDCTFERKRKVEPEGRLTTVKGTVRLGAQEHLYLETHTALAVPSGEKGEVTVWSTTQGPAGVQGAVAKALGLARHKVTVKSKRLGGGFGGKQRTFTALLAAAAAKKFGRQARMALSRSEDVSSTGQRNNMEVRYEATADETGKVVDVTLRGDVNDGCSLNVSAGLSYKMLMNVDGGYTWESFDGVFKNWRTDTVPKQPFRGFGGPEGKFVAETLIEHVAHAVGLDPRAVKERNMTREGELMHWGDMVAKGCRMRECWDEMIKSSRYEEQEEEVKKFNSENMIRKRGISLIPIKYPVGLFTRGMMQGTAYLRIYTDGTVMLSHGGVEMGQGINTKMMQVCSRALGVPMDKIHLKEVDTDAVANGTLTGASTGTDLNGPAVIDACQQMTKRLEPIKKANPEGSWEDWVKAAHASQVSLSVVGHHGYEDVHMDLATKTGRITNYFTYGAANVQVEVDCHTGDVTVLRADLVLDIGKSLNPAIDVGQIEGGFMQGLGYCTTEEMVICPQTGQFLTTGPGTYKIPTVIDAPRELNVTMLPHDGGGSRHTSACYSSKGVGEPPLVLAMGIPAAIRNAVASYRADRGLTDWFHFDIPVTADKIRVAATDEYVEAACKVGDEGADKIGSRF